MGLALGFAVILGITSSFGSLVPLAILHPDQLGTRQGLALMAGTVVMTLGLVFLAVAGKRREREQTSGAAASGRSGFGSDFSFAFSPASFPAMLNFAFVFGEELRHLHAGRRLDSHVGKCHLGARGELAVACPTRLTASTS